MTDPILYINRENLSLIEDRKHYVSYWEYPKDAPVHPLEFGSLLVDGLRIRLLDQKAITIKSIEISKSDMRLFDQLLQAHIKAKLRMGSSD